MIRSIRNNLVPILVFIGLIVVAWLAAAAMRHADYAAYWKTVESDLTIEPGELGSGARAFLRERARQAKEKLIATRGAALTETTVRLNHTDARVQAAAIDILAAWETPEATAQLRAYLDRTGDTDLRGRAAAALGEK